MPAKPFERSAERAKKKFIASLKTGKFVGHPHMKWIAPDLFEFYQRENEPFYFERRDGEIIKPMRMSTDGGSIPKFVSWLPGFSPWEYGPAYILHDWEFEAHRRQLTKKSFAAVNLTLAEAILTLMKTKVCRYNESSLYDIYCAVMSPVGRSIWDGA